MVFINRKFCFHFFIFPMVSKKGLVYEIYCCQVINFAVILLVWFVKEGLNKSLTAVTALMRARNFSATSDHIYL